MKLIFVYNADSGFMNALKGVTQKAVSPKTYSCNLCQVTHPGVTMEAQWRTFIESLPEKPVFLHRDEFHKQYPSQKDIQLPAVFTPLEVAAARSSGLAIKSRARLLTGFTEKSAGLEILIPHTEINKANSVESLIETVRRFLPKPR